MKLMPGRQAVSSGRPRTNPHAFALRSQGRWKETDSSFLEGYSEEVFHLAARFGPAGGGADARAGGAEELSAGDALDVLNLEVGHSC